MLLVSSLFTASPTPPARVLVLYDADCGICTRAACWLGRRDRDRRLDLEPLQAAASLAPDAPPAAELERALHVRAMDGRWHRGGDAVLTALGALPRWGLLAGLVRRTPLSLVVEPAYRLVAANRGLASRLLGAEACPLPTITVPAGPGARADPAA
jgi:predicted DCC family thiol-disulfide oxidoreductase YuxK